LNRSTSPVFSSRRQGASFGNGLKSQLAGIHEYDHPEPVAGNGAAIVPFPVPDDDIIPIVTGLPLVDADPKVIARRLRAKNWKDRTRFFNNVICTSIENANEMLHYARSKDDSADFLDWGLTEMMRRIGETLDLWGATEPADADAAIRLLSSLNPKHQRAGRKWANTQPGSRPPAKFFDTYVTKNWETLAIFFRICSTDMCCAGLAWRAGPQERPDDWFNFPGDDAAA
jgi:hypothetical protein